MAILARLRILRLSAQPRIRGALAWVLMKLFATARPAPVKVSTTARSSDVSVTILLEALGESQATADALATATTLIEEVDAGVWLPEKAFDASTFLDQMTTDSNVNIKWSNPAADNALADS